MVSEVLQGVILGGIIGFLGSFLIETVARWINDRRKRGERRREIAEMLLAEIRCLSESIPEISEGAKILIEEMRKERSIPLTMTKYPLD